MSMPVNENSRPNVNIHPTTGMRSLPNGVGQVYWIKQTVKRNLFQEFVGAGRSATCTAHNLKNKALEQLKEGNPSAALDIALKIIADQEIRSRVLLTVAKYYFDNGKEEEGLATCKHLQHSLPTLVVSGNLRKLFAEEEATKENIVPNGNISLESTFDLDEGLEGNSFPNQDWS